MAKFWARHEHRLESAPFYLCSSVAEFVFAKSGSVRFLVATEIVGRPQESRAYSLVPRRLDRQRLVAGTSGRRAGQPSLHYNWRTSEEGPSEEQASGFREFGKFLYLVLRVNSELAAEERRITGLGRRGDAKALQCSGILQQD